MSTYSGNYHCDKYNVGYLGMYKLKSRQHEPGGSPPVYGWIENKITLKNYYKQNVTQGLGLGWTLRSLLHDGK
jgi:hypothetical protein